jgi:hypothetical protein
MLSLSLSLNFALSSVIYLMYYSSLVIVCPNHTSPPCTPLHPLPLLLPLRLLLPWQDSPPWPPPPLPLPPSYPLIYTTVARRKALSHRLINSIHNNERLLSGQAFPLLLHQLQHFHPLLNWVDQDRQIPSPSGKEENQTLLEPQMGRFRKILSDLL